MIQIIIGRTLYGPIHSHSLTLAHLRSLFCLPGAPLIHLPSGALFAGNHDPDTVPPSGCYEFLCDHVMSPQQRAAASPLPSSRPLDESCICPSSAAPAAATSSEHLSPVLKYKPAYRLVQDEQRTKRRCTKDFDSLLASAIHLVRECLLPHGSLPSSSSSSPSSQDTALVENILQTVLDVEEKVTELWYGKGFVRYPRERMLEELRRHFLAS